MRDARISDHWRHLLERVYPTRLESLEFRSLSFFSPDKLSFSPGITALVGGNGVGKSTLIAAIVELLSNGAADVGIERVDRLAGSETKAEAFVQGKSCNLEMTDGSRAQKAAGAASFRGEFRWLDPSALARRCVEQIRNDPNFQDLLEPVEPIILDHEELRSISYLVGRDYSSCEIYEIGDYGELERFPYILVTSLGAKYGSEGMGRGELALLLCYWTLRDLSRCSILLLEEPETNVSPMSQDRLMNLAARFCEEKRIWAITATHSPAIIRRIPSSHVRLLVRGTGSGMLIPNPTNTQVAQILSGGVAYKGIFLVEDSGAKSFLSCLLETLAPDLFPQFEILSAESADGIGSALKGLPISGDWLTLIGIFDGGIEDEVKATDFRWPYLFIPGGVPPEELLRQMVINLEEVPAELAAEFNKPLADVSLALDSSAGADLHEWAKRLAAGIGTDRGQLCRSLVSLWIQHNDQTAKEFIVVLREAIEKSHRRL